MLIFDFDGVIVDSLVLCTQACHFACRQQGFNPEALPANPFASLNPVTYEALAKIYGLHPDNFAQDVNSFILNHTNLPDVFAEMGDILSNLAKQNRMCVVSATHSTIIKKVLEHDNLLHHFDEVIGGDTLGSKSEKIGHLLQKYQAKQAVMIGDSVSDVDAAKDAGIPAVAVTWGWQSIDLLKNADHIADTPQKLHQILEQITKN